MNSASIKIEFPAGVTFLKAFTDGVAIADKLDCCVEFNVNDLTALVYPGDVPQELVDRYMVCVDKGIDHVFVMSRLGNI